VIESVVDKVNAILMIYLPGNFGGHALADIIFGKVNPSGRLPFNWPRYRNSISNYYRKVRAKSPRTAQLQGVGQQLQPAVGIRVWDELL
jgi:beta-glucosidase